MLRKQGGRRVGERGGGEEQKLNKSLALPPPSSFLLANFLPYPPPLPQAKMKIYPKHQGRLIFGGKVCLKGQELHLLAVLVVGEEMKRKKVRF